VIRIKVTIHIENNENNNLHHDHTYGFCGPSTTFPALQLGHIIEISKKTKEVLGNINSTSMFKIPFFFMNLK